MLPYVITGVASLLKGIGGARRKKKAKKLARKIAREQELQARIQKEQLTTQEGLAEQSQAERFAKMGRYQTGQHEFEREGLQTQLSQSFETIDSQLREGIYRQRQQLASMPSWGEEMFGLGANIGASYIMNDFLTPSPVQPSYQREPQQGGWPGTNNWSFA